MKTLKRLITVLLCVIISISFIINVSAATAPKITVSSVEAIPGKTVKVDIEISNNPGIMAMAFCITYDTNALTYKGYERGYLTSYSVYPHEDEGHVSFVNIENKDVAKNGIIISVLFDVKSDAAPGNYAIALANSNRDKYGTKLHNSFSNSQQDFVVPVVTAGSVTVQESCESIGHSFGEWNITKDATCTETGLKERICARCDAVEEVEIPVTHDFEAEWTVDKDATATEDGIMSRHCTKCNEVTDQKTFKLGDINGDDIITGKDSVAVMQYINGVNVDINNYAADVNDDGKINNKDYVLLVRYLNGWNVELK